MPAPPARCHFSCTRPPRGGNEVAVWDTPRACCAEASCSLLSLHFCWAFYRPRAPSRGRLRLPGEFFKPHFSAGQEKLGSGFEHLEGWLPPRTAQQTPGTGLAASCFGPGRWLQKNQARAPAAPASRHLALSPHPSSKSRQLGQEGGWGVGGKVRNLACGCPGSVQC